MSNELTGSQKYLYSTVYDFISLNHRIPKEQAGGSEAQAVLLLNSLYEELPKICYQMLQCFINVLPQEDVAYIQRHYPNPSPESDQDATASDVTQAPQPSQPAATVNPEAADILAPEYAPASPSLDIFLQELLEDPESSTKPSDGQQGNDCPAQPDAQPESATRNHQDKQAEKAKTKEEKQKFPEAKPQIAFAPIIASETHDSQYSFDRILQDFEKQDSTVWHNHAQHGASAASPSLDKFLQESDDWDLFDDDDDEPKVVLQPRTYMPTNTATQSSSVDGQVARAQKCQNFVQYAWIFDGVKQQTKPLNSKSRKAFWFDLVPVTGANASRQLQIGDVFLINDTFYLIADVIYEKGYTTKHQTKKQFRILVISDDGKYSTPFDASFKSRFDRHKSYRVVASNEQGFQQEQAIRDYCLNLHKTKPVKGYVYVLRTLSQDPVLVEYQQDSELLKIGYTTTSLEERFANAHKETTFLESPVEVLYYVECHNYNPHTFEQLIHQTLDKRRLNVKLKSLVTGKVYQPQEWFTISLEVAIEVIERIMDNTIFKYHLNPINGRLVPNTPAN